MSILVYEIQIWHPKRNFVVKTFQKATKTAFWTVVMKNLLATHNFFVDKACDFLKTSAFEKF